MDREKFLSKIEFIVLYIGFGLLLASQYDPNFLREETFLFIELLMAYFWTMGLFVFAKLYFDLKMFEPLTMITIIYEGIFILKPIVDLHAHQMNEHGINVLAGGDKATMIFVLGYTCFYIAYYMQHRQLLFQRRNLFTWQVQVIELKEKALLVLYAAFALVFLLCVYCMMTQGLSLRYIFSFGSQGEKVVDEKNTALLFLSNFGITAITLWLMIIEYSKNLVIKMVTTLLCAIYILMRNSRWIMLVFILSPIVLFYLKRRKEPKLFWLLTLGFLGLVVFAWMQANRNTLAAGGAMQGWGTDGFTLEKLTAPLESDLSTYRTFYSMVQRYPNHYGYMLGRTFLYTLVLFVPRSLWAAKPDNPVRDMIEHSLNASARQSGTAVANIGEFYANFGYLGVMVLMFALGWIVVSVKRYIFTDSSMSEQTDSKFILYAILYPLFFQLVARGNFSGNFYLLIFALLPILVLKAYQAIVLRRQLCVF